MLLNMSFLHFLYKLISFYPAYIYIYIYIYKRILEFKVMSTGRLAWDLVHLDPPYLEKFLFISIAFFKYSE